MTIVQTRAGKLEGEAQDGLCVFKGIPYAAPPVGALRWRAPQPVEPWSGIRPAGSYGFAAPQRSLDVPIFATFSVREPMSEDCLYLNVWTPAADGARRPVLVWIHGGGFVIGSGAQSIYDGAPLARRGDVVVVTLNYRLGALGFLRLDELTQGRIPATGNEGILDQVAALEWVRDNVEAFGGDPGNVTIFGESAGAMSVGTLLGMPAARGLFHKAIAQSGAAHSATSVDKAAHIAQRIAELAGVATGRADALLALEPERLLVAHATLQASASADPSVPGMPFQPVIDREILPRLPIESIARGSASGVPLLIGSTLEEWNLFALMDPGLFSLTDPRLFELLSHRVGDAAQPLLEVYRKTRSERGQAITPRDLFIAFETDRCFRMPGVVLAETQAAHAPVYAYLFEWKSPLLNGMLGACHAVELGFVFGTLAQPGVAGFAGSGPTAEKLANQTMDSWLAFARSGDPHNATLDDWGRYTAEERATTILGDPCRSALAPFDDERRAWSALPPHVLGQP
jgi:para-nitrobenzyl esterase